MATDALEADLSRMQLILSYTRSSDGLDVGHRMALIQGAGVDVGVVVGAGVAAKVSTSDDVGRLLSELLALCDATFQ
eukprot:jgi/Tetstr1/446508/TSEL_034036.t1